MKNRAKCRLCSEIIESHHQSDWVTCKCNEIAVDGGYAYKCAARHWENFIRIDDEGNEVKVKIEEPSRYEKTSIDPPEMISLFKNQPRGEPAKNNVESNTDNTIDHRRSTKEYILNILQEKIDFIEKMPPERLQAPIDHYDHWSLMLLLRAFFTMDCNKDN